MSAQQDAAPPRRKESVTPAASAEPEPYTGPVSWAGRGERLITFGRAVLAAAALVTIWLDPAARSRWAPLVYTLSAAYAVYAVGLAVFVWFAPGLPRRFGLTTHVLDFALFTTFIATTNGVTSPLFGYLLFATMCGVIRWQWKGALATAASGLAAYGIIGLYAEFVLQDPQSRLFTYVLRVAYLCVIGGFLTFLGVYEQQIRQEVQRLTRWHRPVTTDLTTWLRELAEYAANALGAPRAVIVWHPTGSRRPSLAAWAASGSGVVESLDARHLPLVAEDLAGAPFLCRDLTRGHRVLWLSGGVLREYDGTPLNVSFVLEFRVASVLAWPLAGQSGAGWLFCLDKAHLTSDDLAVGSLAAREVAASIEHFNLAALSRHLAVQEARTRLGRDLHDGLLQALTAARLQLYQLARGLGATGSLDVKSRLSAIEATLAANQRELRLLVEGLRHAQQAQTAPADAAGDTFAALRERMKADWNLTVGEMNLAVEVTEELRRELVLLLQEALVNAARHGRATHAEIRSDMRDGTLVVQVRDNGTGFGFSGRRSADELLRLGVCPTSIRDRLAVLSGSLAVESSDQGACIDMRIPLHTEARVGDH